MVAASAVVAASVVPDVQDVNNVLDAKKMICQNGKRI